MRSASHTYYRYCLMLCLACLCTLSYSQQYVSNPLAQYFRNGYLWNPAYAGDKTQPVGYILHNNSWIGFDGAPTLDVAAAHVSFGSNSGIGAKIMLDKSGILARNTYMLDYSYTLKFSDVKRFRIGVSAGAFTERLQPSAAEAGDPSIAGFNGNKTIVDGNLGGVYENKNFMIAGVIYNLRTGHLQKSNAKGDVARANIMSSVSFLATRVDSTVIKPLLGYKLFSESGGLFTAAIQLERGGTFNAAILWQSTGNVIGNIGLRIGRIAEINCGYSSNNKYGYGEMYEIGIGFGLP